MIAALRRLRCALGRHDWPGRAYEVVDVFSIHGIGYLTASQRCRDCDRDRTVRVLTHNEIVAAHFDEQRESFRGWLRPERIAARAREDARSAAADQRLAAAWDEVARSVRRGDQWREVRAYLGALVRWVALPLLLASAALALLEVLRQ